MYNAHKTIESQSVLHVHCVNLSTCNRAMGRRNSKQSAICSCRPATLPATTRPVDCCRRPRLIRARAESPGQASTSRGRS